ncbi:MAG: glycosyltransferase family 4 protein [Phycisphaerales bacterium]|nr:glycosyltransferase family 4 protein [Phycisphaerales bacterium]
MPPAAPLLLPLPTGLCVSGITTLTLNIAREMAGRGREVTLLLHPEPLGASAIDPDLDPSITTIDLHRLPPLQTANGDLSPWLPAYRQAVLSMHTRHGAPVVAFPNSLGDAFGLLAAISAEHPEALRIVGWQHNDIPYDSRVLEHYEPVLTALVGVSEHLRAALAARLPHRAADCCAITAGVEVPLQRRARTYSPARPLRLLYTGRLDPHQKRIGALPMLSAELDRRGIPHTLTIIGDGPGRDDLARQIARNDSGSVVLLPPAAPARIAELLEQADYFVLPSRFEGLSVAMLEAMARGCIPVVTRVESGLAQVITPGANGLIAEAGPGDDEPAAARALAESIFLSLPRLNEISAAAHATARDRFSLARFAGEIERLIDRAAAAPTRTWPSDRPAAFTARPGDPAGSGTVPPGAAARLRELLESLAGRPVLIHGTGRHTLELAGVLAEYKDRIIAFADDDPAAMGRVLLERRVIAPAREAAEFARAHGAADVIISSFIHQDAIWARRAVYESAGLRVCRLYG